MPAKVSAWLGGGVMTIEGLGKHIPTPWFKAFLRAGWDWHEVPRTFSKKINRDNLLQTQEEAEKLAGEYNNRFNDAPTGPVASSSPAPANAPKPHTASPP